MALPMKRDRRPPAKFLEQDLPSPKLQRLNSAGEAAPAPAGAELDAVMALQGLFTASKSGDSPTASGRDVMAGVRACDVTRFEDSNEMWPTCSNKGWFVKGYEGCDLPFLERLFLILSFPNAELLTRPGRLSDAIRWKDPEAAQRAGAPPGVPCFEIVDVSLFEGEIYPQYASGSFNKTASKWGIASPAAHDAANKKLSRECLFLCPKPGVELSDHPLRPLSTETSVAEVYAHIASSIRPLHRVTPDGAPSLSRQSSSRPLSRQPSASKSEPAMQDPLMMQKILETVKQSADYELSDAQLRAILALKQGPSSSMSRQNSMAPPPAPGGELSSGAPLAAPKMAKQASWGELHVTLWDKVAKKRIPGSAYKGDLIAYLAQNPHLEVYNRQDDKPKVPKVKATATAPAPVPAPAATAASAPAAAPVVTPASAPLPAAPPAASSGPKVVMWHTREQRKLRVEECPTQAGLVEFMKANPQAVVYEGQVPVKRRESNPADIPTDLKKEKEASAVEEAPAASEWMDPVDAIAAAALKLVKKQTETALLPTSCAVESQSGGGALTGLAQLASLATVARPSPQAKELRWKGPIVWK